MSPNELAAIGKIIWIIPMGSILLMWVFHTFYVFAYNFVNDTQQHKEDGKKYINPFTFRKYIVRDSDDIFFAHGIGLLVGILLVSTGLVLWWLFYPIIIGIAVMFVMRHFVRFKKKVMSTLDLKESSDV